MKIRFFLLLASFLFAASFVSSCSMLDDENDKDSSSSVTPGTSSGGSGDSSSSGGTTGGGSSSSDGASSSSSGGTTGLAGGTITEVLLETFEEFWGSGIEFSSQVVADGLGNEVDSLTLTINGKSAELDFDIGDTRDTVNFYYSILKDDACGLVESTKKDQSLIFALTADFKSGSPVTASDTIVVNCALPELEKYDFTLSFSGQSYVDLDESKTYGQTQAITAALRDKIDLVAFYASAAPAKIFTPCGMETGSPHASFWNSDGDCLGGYAELEKYSSSLAETLKEATHISSSISNLMNNTLYMYYDDSAYDGIDIEDDAVFTVKTAEDERYIVVITAHNISGKTVSLRAIPLAQF